MSLSPFFKPKPREEEPIMICYKNTLYTILSTIGLMVFITIPWFIEFTRDVLKEETSRYLNEVSEALVYSTSVVLFVIIISILFLASFFVHMESFRFCIAFGIVILFTPLLLINQWRYVYGVAIMTCEVIIAISFISYAIILLKFDTKEKEMGQP